MRLSGMLTNLKKLCTLWQFASFALFEEFNLHRVSKSLDKILLQSLSVNFYGDAR